MPGETDLHKTLKKEACRWLYRLGYRCIAAEVRLRPLGIVDAVGTGNFRPYQNYLAVPVVLPQVCFVECKASRADFLRDQSDEGQMSLCLMERERNNRSRFKRRRLSQQVGLGKFKTCLMQPMANIHYILAPAGMIKKTEVPPRWGLLSYGEGGVSVVVKACWQENSRIDFVESSIARTLTGDIYRADDRAIASVNREIFEQQMRLRARIRSLRENVVLGMIEELQKGDDATEAAAPVEQAAEPAIEPMAPVPDSATSSVGATVASRFGVDYVDDESALSLMNLAAETASKAHDAGSTRAVAAVTTVHATSGATDVSRLETLLKSVEKITKPKKNRSITRPSEVSDNTLPVPGRFVRRRKR